jgi:mono/diheme cytochrome c family protein
MNFFMGQKIDKKMKSLLIIGAAFALTGCHTDMWKQAKVNPYQESPVFPNAQSARHKVAGTVARGYRKETTPYYTGYENGKLIKGIPVPVDITLLKHGKEKFHIYCTPCHGELGDGKGIVSERGLDLKKPPTYHTDRLRSIAAGHYFDVMTNGFGLMIGFKDKLNEKDRWAVAAYIRALQLSQNANLAQLTQGDQRKVELGISTSSHSRGR